MNRVVVVVLSAIAAICLGKPVQQIVIEALVLLGDLIEDAGDVVDPVVVVTELRLKQDAITLFYVYLYFFA
ncbi:MAG: hypothetical protein ABW094_19585 [Candidatus Thiodiazotropha sp.]